MTFDEKKYTKYLKTAKLALGEKADRRVSIDMDLPTITEAEWLAIVLMGNDAREDKA